jgi:hypothetical protein
VNLFGVNNMSRMSDLDIEMQEMLERGSSVEDVADYFNVPIDWVWQAYSNMLQAYAELWFDNDSWYDEQYELDME